MKEYAVIAAYETGMANGTAAAAERIAALEEVIARFGLERADATRIIAALEADLAAANTAREQAERERDEALAQCAAQVAALERCQAIFACISNYVSLDGAAAMIRSVRVQIEAALSGTAGQELLAQMAALTGLVQEGIDVLGSGFLSGWVVWDDMEGCQFCMARAPRGAYTNVSHDADCPVPLGRIYVKRAKAALSGTAGADLLARVVRLEALANRITDEANEWTVEYAEAARVALAAQPGGEGQQ